MSSSDIVFTTQCAVIEFLYLLDHWYSVSVFLFKVIAILTFNTEMLSYQTCLLSWRNFFSDYIDEDKENNRIAILRLGLIACLIVATISTTIVAHTNLAQSEHELFHSQFDSVALNGLNTIESRFQRMYLGIKEMSVTYSHIFLDVEDWPNVAWTGFQPSGKLMGEISDVATVAILPIVYPHQVAEYESFIANYYNNTDPYGDVETFLFPEFPPGTIFSYDMSKEKPTLQVDHYGNSSNNRRQLMTLLSQYI